MSWRVMWIMGGREGGQQTYRNEFEKELLPVLRVALEISSFSGLHDVNCSLVLKLFCAVCEDCKRMKHKQWGWLCLPRCYFYMHSIFLVFQSIFYSFSSYYFVTVQVTFLGLFIHAFHVLAAPSAFSNKIYCIGISFFLLCICFFCMWIAHKNCSQKKPNHKTAWKKLSCCELCFHCDLRFDSTREFLL